MDDTQRAVIDFLADPATYGGAPVKQIDTHAASVFLAGDRAIKIKRAVRFPFLDFSTLEKRKAACDAEIAVNRAYAPNIYRWVTPITKGSDGDFKIGGKGEAVEWAVEMRRFDHNRTLDRLADAHAIDDTLADALGRAVAAAHRLAPTVRDVHFSDSLAAIIAQNESELTSEPDLFSLHELRILSGATRDAFDRIKTLLARREQAGLVRRCHGDLHLGNIVLIDGKPVLFDAIEFDDRIATIDVFYDLAFLLMDLVERGLDLAASIVFNRYLVETRRIYDLDVLAALPLFMSVRAVIRAKVIAARNRQGGSPAEPAHRARDYAALAQKLMTPAKPRLVAIGGLSGTGKSHLARALAPAIPPLPGAVVLRSDVERKALFGEIETARLPKAAYTADATAKVYATLAAKAQRVLAAGHSAIVDAVFAQPEERGDIARAAAGTAFQGLFLSANLETRLSRVGTRIGDASDATADIVREQEQFDLGHIRWMKVDASGTPEDTLLRAQATIGLR